MQISERCVSFTNQNKTHRSVKVPVTLVVWYKLDTTYLAKFYHLASTIIGLFRSATPTITIPDGGLFWEVGDLWQA
jgi:hypothetical protein